MYVVFDSFFISAFSSLSILNCTLSSARNFSQSSFIFLFSNTIKFMCLNSTSPSFLSFNLFFDYEPNSVDTVLLLAFEAPSLISTCLFINDANFSLVRKRLICGLEGN